MAASFLKNVKLAEDVKSSIVTTCGYFHQSSRKLSARFGKALKRVTDAADDSDEDDSENEFENAVDVGESDNDEDESE